MSNSIWLAIGLVLIVEGLGPLIAPNGWRNMVAQLSQQPDTQLRRIGGCRRRYRFHDLPLGFLKARLCRSIFLEDAMANIQSLVFSL